MKLSSIKYFIVDAFKSIRRNRTISLASMATVLMTLLIFGVFLLAALNVGKGVQDIESKVEIKVFLKDDITMMDQRDVQIKLKEQTGVKDVNYESKEEALDKFKDQLNEYKDLLNGYNSDTNPLPASFLVTLEKPEYAKDVANSVSSMTGVENIGNDQDVINKISSFTKAVRWVGVALFVILVAVSLFLIINTIKLTVFSRRREIGIMKFVGATDWFIRWPFIIEGVIIGLVGAIMSNIILFFSYKALFSLLSKQLITVSLVSPYYVLSTMSWEFILGGILIGAFGSIIALRKFLVV
ncbi:permease-like cell division protein FtsX [Clostridium sp. 'White wine YQ']|uniref:permease-like cell division protein FtsX n=1 Tax=Clostridium sp. 'White wine YQ' TaxID=3027474 RepID=UPI002366EDFE|nr:permease-like cell division protein FtsX [Clostridium sp. 'White wine YQ']MDD7795655.1 permease-like cell division protein FtsX [Clostridium sp. 'White wine YQ']